MTEQGKPRYHGLKNQGATCYLNSVLQVLYMTKHFREAVKGSKSPQDSHGCIDYHLNSVFETLTREIASTQKITNHLGIKKVNEQHDAAECFNKILSCSSSTASEIFQGVLTHKNTCSKCGNKTKSKSPFWSLPLTLSEIEFCPITDAVQKYFQESKICGENQLYCNMCNGKTDSSIKLEMHHHPDVLTLLLKRFKFDYNNMDYVKIKCNVQIPYILEIPTTENKSQHYQLYAYVEHSGELRSGHYTAVIKSEKDGKWYTFNDSMVTMNVFQSFQLDNKETSSSAYLLFYRKNSYEESTSGCFNSNEQYREDVETTQREEWAADRTEITGFEEKTKDREQIKAERVVKNEWSKMTGTDDDSLMSKSTEHRKPSGKKIDNNRNCNHRRLDGDEQNRDKGEYGSEKPNYLKQSPKPVSNKIKKRKDPDHKKHTNHQQSRKYQVSKIENSHRSKQNISTSSHEGQEGKEENPKNYKHFQSREKSERLFGESESNQKNVQHDRDGQNNLEGDKQPNMNSLTKERTVKIDTNPQNNIKINDEEMSNCISIQNKKYLLEQQIQSDEKISTESENIENVSESTNLTVSSAEKTIQVSSDVEKHHKRRKQKKKNKKNKKK